MTDEGTHESGAPWFRETRGRRGRKLLILFKTFIPTQNPCRSGLKSGYEFIDAADFTELMSFQAALPRLCLFRMKIFIWSNKCWIFKWECLTPLLLNNLAALRFAERRINAHLQAAAVSEDGATDAHCYCDNQTLFAAWHRQPKVLAGSGVLVLKASCALASATAL